MGRVPLCPQNYLEVGVRVGIRQPGGPRALLVLEGPVKGLRDGAEVEDAHGGGGDAVPGSRGGERRRQVRKPRGDRCPPTGPGCQGSAFSGKNHHQSPKHPKDEAEAVNGVPLGFFFIGEQTLHSRNKGI